MSAERQTLSKKKLIYCLMEFQKVFVKNFLKLIRLIEHWRQQ